MNNKFNLKKFFNLFILYYKQFRIISLSILILPLLNFISSLFKLKKKIKIKNYQNKIKTINLNADNYVTHFRSNLFFLKEKEVRFFIDKYLDNNSIFFDIGANIGIFSLYSAITKNAYVYCFEPEYSNLSLLKENIINSSLTSKIFPYSLAVGNKLAITNLHVADFTPGAAVSSISDKKIDKTHEGFDVIWKEGVMEVTLDFVCESLNLVPEMIKIDTDGNEKNVLLGAENTLKDDKLKFIIMEKPSNKEKLDFCYNFLKINNFNEVEISDKRNSFWLKNFD